MNVETFATSGPHVSAIMSSVRACVPISIPLLTKIINGSFSRFKVGFKDVSVSLVKGIS